MESLLMRPPLDNLYVALVEGITIKEKTAVKITRIRIAFKSGSFVGFFFRCRFNLWEYVRKRVFVH
jgi:hypothetical protein